MEEPNQTHERWRDNALTIPNLISILRLAAVPVFVWLLIGENRPLAAAALLGILGATDWVDGWVARRFDQISELGKVLDPTADRIMFLVAVFTMMIDGSVPIWFGILTLIVVEVGLITPPVGLNVFIINKMAKNVPISDTFIGVLPFLISDLVRVGILFIFPSISLFLIRLLG